MRCARQISFVVSLFPLLAAGPVPTLHAQESTEYGGGSSLDLGVSGVGISFGGAPRWTGLRFNWRDRYLERIDGLNSTLWKPGESVGGSVNGVALGLGPRAGYLRGVSIGLLGVMPERAAYGVTIGGLGVVAEGSLTGLNVGLLGIVTEGPAYGLSIAGLGLVTEGGATGINVAGLGVVSEGTVAGINLAGLGLVAERGIHGINGALLGVVTEGELRGITVTGLGAVAEGNMTGNETDSKNNALSNSLRASHELLGFDFEWQLSRYSTKTETPDDYMLDLASIIEGIEDIIKNI